jgi:hypothetical protein
MEIFQQLAIVAIESNLNRLAQHGGLRGEKTPRGVIHCSAARFPIGENKT